MKAGKQLSRIIASAAVTVSLVTAASTPLASAQTQSPTAGAAQQSNHGRDLAMTRDIRRALIKDKSLSTSAHNVTIVTRDGKVTLKGEVKSQAEKQAVETAATTVAGTGNVDDQLSIYQ